MPLTVFFVCKLVSFVYEGSLRASFVKKTGKFSNEGAAIRVLL